MAGTFSASAGNRSAGDSVRLQILLDGAACDPLTGNFSFPNYNAAFGSNSTDFFCGAQIGLGVHTLQVQYHSGSGGEAVINPRTLEIRHR